MLVCGYKSLFPSSHPLTTILTGHFSNTVRAAGISQTTLYSGNIFSASNIPAITDSNFTFFFISSTPVRLEMSSAPESKRRPIFVSGPTAISTTLLSSASTSFFLITRKPSSTESGFICGTSSLCPLTSAERVGTR